MATGVPDRRPKPTVAFQTPSSAAEPAAGVVFEYAHDSITRDHGFRDNSEGCLSTITSIGDEDIGTRTSSGSQFPDREEHDSFGPGQYQRRTRTALGNEVGRQDAPWFGNFGSSNALALHDDAKRRVANDLGEEGRCPSQWKHLLQDERSPVSTMRRRNLRFRSKSITAWDPLHRVCGVMRGDGEIEWERTYPVLQNPHSTASRTTTNKDPRLCHDEQDYIHRTPEQNTSSCSNTISDHDDRRRSSAVTLSESSSGTTQPSSDEASEMRCAAAQHNLGFTAKPPAKGSRAERRSPWDTAPGVAPQRKMSRFGTSTIRPADDGADRAYGKVPTRSSLRFWRRTVGRPHPARGSAIHM